MARRTIPQRELRNDVARILREAEAGAEFEVTVRGHPVAYLGPPLDRPRRQIEVDGQTLSAILASTPVDPDFARDVAELRIREAQPGDPWAEHGE